VKRAVAFVSEVRPFATMVWLPGAPAIDGTVAPQLNVPVDEAVVLHSTTLCGWGGNRPVLYWTLTVSPGLKPPPEIARAVPVEPDDGDTVREVVVRVNVVVALMSDVSPVAAIVWLRRWGPLAIAVDRGHPGRAGRSLGIRLIRVAQGGRDACGA
jgi:hypothetical protein